jgi:hypothetical protein
MVFKEGLYSESWKSANLHITNTNPSTSANYAAVIVAYRFSVNKPI